MDCRPNETGQLSASIGDAFARTFELQGDTLQKGYLMPQKMPESNLAATAADIERSIQKLNKKAERLWGDGREAEAKALLDALDALNRVLDRIRIGKSRRILH